tara:strand:- start:826 stop:1104 length:279 start_codon:yes stop_codon:yes gene_type:complete
MKGFYQLNNKLKFVFFFTKKLNSTISISHKDILLKIKPNTNVPFHERYETVDFCIDPLKNEPKIKKNKSCHLLKSIKTNDIPFYERYETIDF